MNAPRIAILGDPILDTWVQVQPSWCQDDCVSYRQGETQTTPGGAANALHQLLHWPVQAQLIGPISTQVIQAASGKIPAVSFASRNPEKVRFVDAEGHILARLDREVAQHGLTPERMEDCRTWALEEFRRGDWDGCLLSDYGKGFLTPELVGDLIEDCNQLDIPVVADPRLPPSVWQGALLKCNTAYALQHGWSWVHEHHPGVVVTRGGQPPSIFSSSPPITEPGGAPVLCRNHVGAGDCFAAVLTYLLARHETLALAVRWAHAAGRVYVQHPGSRPPWPHEVYKDLEPRKGKVLGPDQLPALTQSVGEARLVFTNGVFRLPHAGHVHFLQWAKDQGDILVVGINDDLSAHRERGGAWVMPLAERLEILTALDCVDWIVPFAEPTPEATIRLLEPELLVKGFEYREENVPGSYLVPEVRFGPRPLYPDHASDLEGKNGGSPCS